MSEKRDLIRRQLLGQDGGGTMPFPTTHDERRIAAKAARGAFALQVSAAMHRYGMYETMRARTYGVEQYAVGVGQMIGVQERSTDEVRDYLEPFVMNQAVELAHDLQALGSSAAGSMLRIAAQDYTVQPQGFWQRLLGAGE